MRQLTGFIQHQLDQKGRMRIPPKYRKLIGEEVVIMASPSGCLELMSAEKYAELTARFSDIPRSDLAAQKIIRKIAESTFCPVEDNQGRFILPAALRKYADISKSITFIGMFDKVEIWATEIHDKEQGGELDPVSFADDFMALEKYGI